ncbi:MAG: hypothetical protein GXY81_07860 [Candidatus Cloacimonetes bacterium]|nr:hypothetical protein [Candidatus Cloacimonadota bacterium]
MLSGQNLWLRLLILVMALFSALDASWRQIILLMLLYLIFMLLELDLYPKLWRGLRFSLPFLAAYWVFGTLFGRAFPDLVLFSLKLIFLIETSVWCFANLYIKDILRDTRGLQKRKWGKKLLRFALATGLYIRAYFKMFERDKIKGHNSIGAVLDSMVGVGTRVYQSSGIIEAQLEHILKTPLEQRVNTLPNLLGMSLLAVMVLISAV